MNKAYVFSRQQAVAGLASGMPLNRGRAGIAVFADLFLGPLARQGLLHALLLARLQVIRVALYFLMMSSVWTLRLNRRSAFSSGSPSCNRTSAKLFLRAKVKIKHFRG